MGPQKGGDAGAEGGKEEQSAAAADLCGDEGADALAGERQRRDGRGGQGEGLRHVQGTRGKSLIIQCIAFELLDGNLYELLSSSETLSLSDSTIRVFAMQLLNALQLLKSEGVIHCDIKPENILMQKWGKSGLKLADFGTSCFDGQQLYTYLQSRYYRSPEIILRQPYSFPIDMWSLACVLF